MIKIHPYKNEKRILDRYLYLMASILPFCPADVLGANKITVDEKEITASNAEVMITKSPRKRGTKYNNKLIKYGITETCSADEPEMLKNDRILAAKIVEKASAELYEYLYDVTKSFILPANEPVVNKANLKKLLTVKMDDLESGLGLDIEKMKSMKEDSVQELLDFVFCYERFSNRAGTIELLMDMDVSVCPYCNRMYTFTVKRGSGKSRPQFDHYLPKSKYPYFAVSFYNLIPCCGLCNQSKSNTTGKVLYPYSEGFENNVVFRTERKEGFDYLLGIEDAKDEFEVVIELERDDLEDGFLERLKNSKKSFYLKELYDGHRDYILQLYRARHIYNEEYIETLMKSFSDMLSNEQDIKTLIYLMDISEDNWGRRSLCKLTHDIDKEITKMKGK